MKTDSQTLLEKRAARLAAPPPQPAEHQSAAHAIATVGKTHYAVPFEAVVAIAPVQQLAALPGVSRNCASLINFRGSPVLAFHMPAILERPRQGIGERTQAVVLGRQQPQFALLADATEEMRSIAAEKLSGPPDTLSPEARELITGVTDDGIVVLSASGLFESPRTHIATYIGRQA